MKHRRSSRWRALLLAALVLGAGDALADEAAGPELSARSPEPAPAPTEPAPTEPTDASAPPAAAPSAADAERAKNLYALGAEAFAAQHNAEAVGYFRRAAELVPSAKLTYNIGLAYEEMGDPGRALAEYRSYLTQEREADASRVEEVRGRIAKLEHRLAETGVQQLFVTSQPPGARVRIAGRALGVTPWAGELAPGRYALELELPGHARRQSEVTLAAEHASELSFTLAPQAPDAPRDEPSRPARISPLAWTFLGVGAGGLAGGLVFELSRGASRREADRSADALDAARADGAADAKQMASLLLFGFGAGFSIGGAVLLALDLGRPDPAPPRTAFALPCTPAFCGVQTRAQF